MGADEDILERQLFPEQLSDESQREEFVCKVTRMRRILDVGHLI